ncbi:MAG TPA: substrate-binding domain-containing protein [Polyangiaceae bacterium]|jgi:molybdate-binding protein/DNA-binding XRE family transcriptional regulator|nr:substrate-binding domain-containing protein [Polyangiaceae bacterium]
MGGRPNRVREFREKRGLSQSALGEAVRLSRQSLSAIEAGKATPAVDVALRLGRALECPVEELFGSPHELSGLQVSLAGAPGTARLALAWVQERWVGLPLAGDGALCAADALVLDARGRRAHVTPLVPLAQARENLVVMGCAVGLGLLSDRLSVRRGAGRYLWLPASSGAALDALAQGLTHIAGVHSVGAAGTDGNIEAVRRARASQSLVLVTLARWEAGLLTRADDQRVQAVADVGSPGVRLIAREQGAAARQLLERRLRAAGVSSQIVRSAPLVAAGHMDVARAIAMGAADVGVATRDAAMAFGLRFLPLAQERYDLVVPEVLLADSRVERWLDALVSQANRRELASLGYDVTDTGSRVAEVKAA